MTPTRLPQKLRIIAALMIREMITRYGRSWGGYVWAVLEPVATIVALATVMSQFFQVPPIGSSFALFYASGFLPYALFNEVSTQVGTAVHVNRTLMDIPGITPIEAVLARMILSVLTHAVVALMILGGIALIDPGMEVPYPEHLLTAMALATLLGLAVGSLNVSLFAFMPTWRNVWPILKAPLFLISGILFLYAAMPSDIRSILWWNPLLHVVGESRQAFYSTYDAGYVDFLWPLVIGTVGTIAGFGLMILHRSAIVAAR